MKIARPLYLEAKLPICERSHFVHGEEEQFLLLQRWESVGIPEGNKNRKEFRGKGEENVVDFNIGSLSVYVCVFLRFINKMLTDLPFACLYCVSAFLSPRDVAQAECVSRACLEMFGCDAVWERFLPAAYEDVLASATEFPPDLLSKKAVFLYLSRGVLLHNGTQAHWLDEATGGVCYSVAARGLRVVWGENEQYWSWFPVRGSRWPEIAHLDAVCWFRVSGELSCLLPAGAYTLSWRLKLNRDLSFQGSQGNYGWSIRPVDFSLSLCNDTQASNTQRYLTNEPGISALQEQLPNLTPVRLVNDDWMEYDAGEIIVEEGEKGADLKFEMKEIVSAAWKGGVMVDGVVLRPTSLAQAIGQSLTVAELRERFLQDHEDHEVYEHYEEDEFDEDDEYDEGEEVAEEMVEVEEEDTTAAAAETPWPGIQA